MRIDDDFVAKVGRDGQAVEDEGLDVSEDVCTAEGADNAPQGTPVKAVFPRRTKVSPNLS